MMLPQRGLTLWTWMFNRQSHVFNYYIGHFYARMFLRFTPSPRALYSPPLLFLPFPYSSGDHCYSLTSLHPKLPHAVPVLTDCVAAASAEITTQHPGGEQPADGIDYLYCQNNQLGRMPTLACLDVGESEDLEWRIGRIFSFFFPFLHVADLDEFQTEVEVQVLACLMHIHTKLHSVKCTFTCTYAAAT